MKEAVAHSTQSGNPRHQFLVRFQSKTHVISLPQDRKSTQDEILNFLADRTGWPVSYLRVGRADFPFVDVQVRSSIRGGKGGFGTLLKGQSRQAGAKMTTDFGACRDLQGRRLRHVNDEVKLRKWRERQRKEAMGEKVENDDMWNTPSGLYNWHLMTPTWADISKRDTNRIKRQFKKMDRKLENEMASKKEQDELYHKTMTHYLDETSSVSESVQYSLKDAIKQGLKNNDAVAATKNKRKRRMEGGNLDDKINETPTNKFLEFAPEFDEQPNSLVSLSGDVVVETPPDDGPIKLQSKSDFMTAVFVLDRREEPTLTSESQKLSPPSYYYEVTLVTGGLAQIGWACLADSEGNSVFLPSNDLGDGVGDDTSSFGIDGSRGLKFHGGNEWKVPFEWKKGDRLGCCLDLGTRDISYTLNGEDLGIVFANTKPKQMMPAFSCNKDEILELHFSRKECKFFPTKFTDKNVIAVKDLVSTSKAIPSESRKIINDLKKHAVEKNISKLTEEELDPQMSAHDTTVTVLTLPEVQKSVEPQLLDLEQFKDTEELEKLGLDRLKSALLALNVKCGGNLSQRADRLFSLKGLEYKDYPKKVRSKSFILSGGKII